MKTNRLILLSLSFSDLLWPVYTPFEVFLCGFRPTNIVAIRTVKSRPVVDVRKDIKLPEPDWSLEDWHQGVYWHQGYAVIHFYKKV